MSRPLKPTHDVFDALSNPLRRRILEVLQDEGEQPVSDLAKRFPIGLPTLSHHLRKLRQVKLVSQRQVGQARLYTYRGKALLQVQRWLIERDAAAT